MGERRALVIGSECSGLPNLPLEFLPELAQSLFTVLTDPHRGECVKARSQLVLDPDLEGMKAAIKDAFAAADANRATLVIAFIGHAEAADGRLFLLPRTGISPPDIDTAYQFGERLSQLLGRYSNLDGLVLLVDTCQSGVGVADLALNAVEKIAKGGARVQLLTSTFDQAALDGCFTRNLHALLRDGMADLPQDYLLVDAVAPPIAKACSAQEEPRWLVFQGQWEVNDPGLYLARNVHPGRRRPGRIPLVSSLAATVVDQLTAGFEAPALLEGLVARARRGRWVTVTGPPGSGKSTLLAALSRPELSAGRVPEGFLHAIAFCDRTTTARSMAYELRDQLLTTVPSYPTAVAEHRQSAGVKGWDEQDPLTQYVFAPLSRSGPGPVRLVVDGLDQLDDALAGGIHATLISASGDPSLGHVYMVVSWREAEEVTPAHGSRLAVTSPAPEVLARYLEGRRLQPRLASMFAAACAQGSSAWLLARLVADTYGDLSETAREDFLSRLSEGEDRTRLLAVLYDKALDHVGAADKVEWHDRLYQVLAPLAAAGAGPVMPLNLLCAVSAQFGGPHEPARVRDVLVRLGRLVVRNHPGTDREVVGLFHPTLAEHLGRHARQRVDVISAHRVLLEEIDRLAPVTGIYVDNPLYRWATEAEAEHLWELGEINRALHSLWRRPLPTPRENLARWTMWHSRVRSRRGPHHPDTLTVRGNIAHWTGETGDGEGALALYRELLPDFERVLGPHHPDTLTVRGNIAHWTGETGDGAGALALSREVLPDLERVLGPHHPDTLTVRDNIAAWIGQMGDGAGALRLSRELLPDLERVLGPHHPDTLTVRGNIAHWTGQTGDGAGALALLRELLPDRERVLGPHHPDTLITRGNIAPWIGQMGDGAGALALLRDLLSDSERVLGPHHPDTLTVRGNIAHWTGQTGDGAGALTLYRELLPDLERVLGPHHPDTLTGRRNIAAWTGQTGDGAGALTLYRELLPDLERVLGPHHPDTLATRSSITHWAASHTGE